MKPSNDLIKAENQLLNYYYDNKNNASFLKYFSIEHPDKLKLGGIIIGSERTRYSGRFTNNDTERLERLYKKALSTSQILWHCEQIKIYTWDQILDYIKPIEEGIIKTEEDIPITTISGDVKGVFYVHKKEDE